MQEYINSGMLEAYVLGCATEQEAKEVLRMKTQYPEINAALTELEADMEKLAATMAVTPPANAWNKIEQEIDEIILRQPAQPEIYREKRQGRTEQSFRPDYINVESESTHMRIHKAWKWVFAAVFVLGKIFLGFAIYYYLESRQAKEQIQEMKTELRQLKK